MRSVSVCGDLSDTELAKLQTTMGSIDLDKGQCLIDQGATIENLYIVTHGSLRLLKVLEDGRQQITGFVFPGDFIGVRAGAHSNYAVEALTPSRVCIFPYSSLKRVMEAHPSMLDRLIGKADTELTKAYNHMILLGQKTVHERVSSFFCDLVEQIGKHQPEQGPGAYALTLSMPRRDIADYLALRSETLSRVLKDLKSGGFIREETRTKIIIPSLPALREHSLIAEEG